MTDTYTITLSLPPRVLGPNDGHGHWAAKARAFKKYKGAAHYAMLGATTDRPMWTKATTYATFYFKVRRNRDADNHAAMLKSAWDGICAAGLVANDTGLTHTSPVFEIDKANPRVELRVERTE